MTPLYLHFLDRELGESVGTALSTREALGALETLVLSTQTDFYAGLSLVWEHPSIDSRLRRMVEDLVASRQLDLVSSHPQLDEFLASRQVLYRHDRDRYPAYFSGGDLPFIPTARKPASTTVALAGRFAALADAPSSGLLGPDARAVVAGALERWEGQAITSALFAPSLLRSSPRARRDIGIAISTLYTEDYRDALGGDIATGIAGLGWYDDLAAGFPTADVAVAQVVLSKLGLAPLIERVIPGSEDAWNLICSSRNYRSTIADPVAAILRCAALQGAVADANQASRTRLRAIIEEWFGSAGTAPQAPDAVQLIERAGLRARALVAEILRRHPWLRPAADRSRRDRTLVVTATDVEAEVLRAVMEAAKRTVQHRCGPGLLSHFEVAPWRTTEVIWVRCRAGSGTRGGSQDVVSDAIASFAPSRVIMVGIAFGINEATQPIGTVLVADRVVNYDFVRVGTASDGEAVPVIKDRSEVGVADIRLVESFRDIGIGQVESTEVGLLLSGPELVDNLERRNNLVAGHPDAIGGEMEGYGVYVACSRPAVPWVLVKAVCDWGDGMKGVDKESRQRTAAKAAGERLVRYLEGGSVSGAALR